jgi:hypothetical protein
MWVTKRATSSTEPVAASTLARWPANVVCRTVIAMEEPSLLLPVHKIVSRMKIKNNLVWCLLVRLQGRRAGRKDRYPSEPERVVANVLNGSKN